MATGECTSSESKVSGFLAVVSSRTVLAKEMLVTKHLRDSRHIPVNRQSEISHMRDLLHDGGIISCISRCSAPAERCMSLHKNTWRGQRVEILKPPHDHLSGVPF